MLCKLFFEDHNHRTVASFICCYQPGMNWKFTYNTISMPKVFLYLGFKSCYVNCFTISIL
jgi:hypothetical protein